MELKIIKIYRILPSIEEIREFIENELEDRNTVGCVFQRTTKPNTHKAISRRKAFLTLTAKLYCMPMLLNGALENCTLRDSKNIFE